MTKKELSIELENWFKSANKSYKNFWTTDPVAVVIKGNLLRMNNFKNVPGGDPRKAIRKAAYNRAVENGYDGLFEG